MSDPRGEPDAEPDAAPAGSRRRAALVLLAIAVVSVLIAGGVYWAASRGSKPAAVAAPPSPTFAPVVVPAATTPAPAVTPTPHNTPHTKHRLPHEIVAAAAPSGFRYQGKGYTINASVCGMAYVRPLDPPGEQHHTVCWVEHDFGSAPGTNGRGTTYVLGHAWAEDPQEVLNRISQPATRQILKHKAASAANAANSATMRSGIATYPVSTLDGDVLSLHTPNGVLRYTVHDAYGVAKEQAGDVHSLMNQNTRHRVVLITCAERHGVDYDYNIIVEAYLTSSISTRSRT